MASSETEVARVLFLILAEGDRRKMAAISNDSPTGGGARDLRFRPESEFLPFFGRMLPEVVIERSHSREIETYVGNVRWEAAGKRKSRQMRVWPATKARPNECRISRINQFGFSDLVKEDPGGGESIFMLIQQRNGVVRVYFTTETSLRLDDWNSIIKNFAMDWLATSHKCAFLDVETGERFPHD